MSLRLVASEVVVVADRGRFSGRADFTDGLNFIRADNNMGKTTLLMSALYAIGLEGMLGPGAQAPLKPAVQTEIQDENGNPHTVIESWVMTEVENGDGERLTLRRQIVGSADNRLVNSWEGPALTDPTGGYSTRDFFVRMEGAARREAGLHHRLTSFLGWELPEVATWDGRTVPLYVEIVAPFFFVEQTRGWSGIAAVMPRYLRVRDPERRAIEFLGGLSALTRARDRDVIVSQLGEIKADWRAAVEGFATRVSEIGGTYEGLPKEAPADWPPSPPVTVRVLIDDEWIPLNRATEMLRAQLDEASRELPLVEQVADKTAEELRRAEERMARLSAQLAAANRDMAEQRGEFEALNERIRAIEEDRGRHRDAIRLSQLGSIQALAVAESRCPTCDQHLPTTLLGEQGRPVMTLEDNKALLDEERQTFLAMRSDAEGVLQASRHRVVGVRRELDDARAEVRSLKATLTQNAKAPSRAIIERQVRLAQRIEQFDGILDMLIELDTKLGPLAERNRHLQAELKRLSGEGTTPEDTARLEVFAQSIREQLGLYGFSSVPAGEIEIAPDNYLPLRFGEPLLAKDISASDNVRLVWAYLTGLMELARQFETPHPGLIVFDEPGQQDISDASLQGLLRRLSETASYAQQAIVATSKPSEKVTQLLGDSRANRNDFAGHVLRAEA